MNELCVPEPAARKDRGKTGACAGESAEPGGPASAGMRGVIPALYLYGLSSTALRTSSRTLSGWMTSTLCRY